MLSSFIKAIVQYDGRARQVYIAVDDVVRFILQSVRIVFIHSFTLELFTISDMLVTCYSPVFILV